MVDYGNALKLDNDETVEYFSSFVKHKSEQQKDLEKLLLASKILPNTIADIACGGGVTAHLSRIYPQAQFTLIDSSNVVIIIASDITRDINAICDVGDIYNLKLDCNSQGLVVCWQTLSWLDDPKKAMHEPVRICRPGGLIVASYLFNLIHDVDIYAKVVDHTRKSGSSGVHYNYNTYSVQSVQEWLDACAVTSFAIKEFSITKDLYCARRGLGTYTLKLDNGRRVQASAGLLLNWGILEVYK